MIMYFITCYEKCELDQKLNFFELSLDFINTPFVTNKYILCNFILQVYLKNFAKNIYKINIDF